MSHFVWAQHEFVSPRFAPSGLPAFPSKSHTPASSPWSRMASEPLPTVEGLISLWHLLPMHVRNQMWTISFVHLSHVKLTTSPARKNLEGWEKCYLYPHSLLLIYKGISVTDTEENESILVFITKHRHMHVTDIMIDPRNIINQHHVFH